MRECAMNDGCKTGKSVITKGYNLPAKCRGQRALSAWDGVGLISIYICKILRSLSLSPCFFRLYYRYSAHGRSYIHGLEGRRGLASVLLRILPGASEKASHPVGRVLLRVDRGLFLSSARGDRCRAIDNSKMAGEG